MFKAPLLSQLVSRALTRRRFVQGIPAVTAAAAALASCERSAQDSTGAERQARGPQGSMNSNSRLDTAVVKDAHAGSITPSVSQAEAAQYHHYDPALPPLSDQSTHRVHWRAQEMPLRISPTTVIGAWMFEGDVPGPILHVREGDTVEFTLTNEGSVAHSMDFHAAQLNPKNAFRSVSKGQSVSFAFRPRFAGAFVYHCGTAPVLMHIGAGMYGAIIVSPRRPLPQAKEFVLVPSTIWASRRTASPHSITARWRRRCRISSYSMAGPTSTSATRSG